MYVLPMGMILFQLQLNPLLHSLSVVILLFVFFKSADTALIYLKKCDWSVFEMDSSLDTLVSCVYTHLDDAISRHVPVKTSFHIGQRGLWLTEELDKLIKERDRRCNRYRRTWTDHNLQLFIAARDNAHKATEEVKLLFYHERLRDLHESDKVWKELRNLGLCSIGVDSPCIFTTEKLNCHFFSI